MPRPESWFEHWSGLMLAVVLDYLILQNPACERLGVGLPAKSVGHEVACRFRPVAR